MALNFPRTRSRYLTSVAVILLSGVHSVSGVEHAVLLKNGSVLVGETQQLANTVVVTTERSTLRIPIADVDYVADSVVAIYGRKSLRAKRPSAIETLISWCLQNDLPKEAQNELAKLRTLVPSHRNLDALQRRIAQHGANANRTRLPAKHPLHPDSENAKQHIDSLSNESLRSYARVVQPLLLNRCAIAGCHGKAPTSKYQLLGRGHSTVSQNLTLRNLGATLRQLDAPPTQSLLWISASQPHGGAKQAMARKEADRLFAWIQRSSSELGIETAVRTSVRQASAEAPIGAVDPFDPAEFNSLHRDAVAARESTR